MNNRNLAWVTIALSVVVVACNDEPHPCSTTRDCEMSAEHAGLICSGRSCGGCATDADCAAPNRYGPGATCRSDGRCERACAPGTADCICDGDACSDGLTCTDGVCVGDTGCRGCACGPDEECDAGLECHDGTCETACAPGTVDCVCDSVGMCDDGLTCSDGVCEDCAGHPGALGCSCRDDGTCDADNRCEEGRCVPPCDESMTGARGCMCGAGGSCSDDRDVCRSGVCVECNPSLEGCPCVSGGCIGLVCGGGVCRAPVTCEEAGCLPNQRCRPSSRDRDAVCLLECDPGSVWDATRGECVSVSEDINCIPGHPSSILDACMAQNRGCMSLSPGARCSDCLAGYIEVEGSCRSPIQCGELGCAAQYRGCAPATPTSDARCTSCLPGFRANASGVCEPDTSITCAMLESTCRAENRSCDESGGSARCADCLTGYVLDPALESCVPNIPCVDLGCAAQNRVCEGTPRRCTSCLPGYVADAADGHCRLPISCDSGMISCPPPQTCEDRVGADARCSGDACPDPSTTYDVYSSSCVLCPFSCTGGTAVEGETGRVAPGTVYRGVGATGACICETEPGYFYDLTGGAGTSPCDADGDGWVRQTARASVEATDDVLRAQARCTLHVATAFELESEAGQTHVEPMTTGIPLYESLRNDSDAELSPSSPTELTARLREVPHYPTTTVACVSDVDCSDGLACVRGLCRGRRPRASELNSLVKLCSEAAADHNNNFVPDVQEYAGAALTIGSGGSAIPPALAPLYHVYTRFSYFAELHTAEFAPTDPASYETRPMTGPHRVDGVYRISERLRGATGPAGGVALGYGRHGADPDENYYQSCRRRRDVDFAARSEATGLDFAAYSAPDGRALMMHHSQYRCLQLVDDADWASRGPSERHLVRAAELEPTSAWTVNSCEIEGTPVSTSGIPNPDETRFACTGSAEPPVLALNQVFWGAVNYLHGTTPRSGVALEASLPCGAGDACPEGMMCIGGACRGRTGIDCTSADDCPSGMQCTSGFCRSSAYVRGCIDECTELDSLPVGERCPGLGTPGVACEADAANFGRLQCGCARNYGGAACEIGCPVDELMTSPEPDFRISPRSGYWMCGHFSASDGAVMSGGGYTLRGEIPVNTADGTVLGASTGYTLRAR